MRRSAIQPRSILSWLGIWLFRLFWKCWRREILRMLRCWYPTFHKKWKGWYQTLCHCLLRCCTKKIQQSNSVPSMNCIFNSSKMALKMWQNKIWGYFCQKKSISMILEYSMWWLWQGRFYRWKFGLRSIWTWEPGGSKSKWHTNVLCTWLTWR